MGWLFREPLAFAVTLAALVGVFLGEALVGGKVLSPADVLYATRAFEEFRGPDYEPANRLLMDPVLQFQPWLEFNRAMLRRGRLPLWNSLAGCGAPHLANAQSGVFDPFHGIAYLGPLPDAHAWMAAARLWVAGLGMFLLARRWGLGPWGRWFAGLTFPFCGFLVVWLLFPVTSAAIWLPWVLLASDRALERPGPRTVVPLGLAVGAALLAGHVQTSAHVLLAAGMYVVWRLARGRSGRRPGPIAPRAWISGWLGSGLRDPGRGVEDSAPTAQIQARATVSRCLATWTAGVTLGVALAAVEVVPLAFYLTRSPVWVDRARNRPPIAAAPRPRLLDAVCTALPYAFGSQRRGHPNLAKALGVHNLNESAGGFVGLATLIWLAPAAWSARRAVPRVRFLTALAALGALGAFEVPPVANLLRAVPVLDVMDQRRLTLWVASGLALLGGIGLDHLHASGRGWGRWVAAWAIGAVGLVAVAGAVRGLAPAIRSRALAHYARAAERTPGADPAVFRSRAERQARSALAFVPRYALLSAGNLLTLAALAVALRRGRLANGRARGVVLALVLIDLFGFGLGLNPAIARADDRPAGALIAYLSRVAPPPARILGVGAELPPNCLMRYGLADVRNYDAIEAARNLDDFAPLYEPGPARTSRRDVTWSGVARARDRLCAAGVAAVVGPTPPPAGLFPRVDRVGRVWVGRWPRTGAGIPMTDHGYLNVRIPAGHPRLAVAETFDPGWRAEVDGRPVRVEPLPGAFLAVPVAAGACRLVLCYDPPEVRAAAAVTLLAALLAGAIGARCGPAIAGKTTTGAWKGPLRRVTIGLVISDGPRHRLPN